MGIKFANPRSSPIVSIHQELGAEFFVWNQMLVPKKYSHDVTGEHLAVRTSSGLTDMSGIKKFWIKGADASQVLDFLITRDCSQIKPGAAVYSALLNNNGYLIEDAIVFRLSPKESEHYDASWLICFGDGFGADHLEKSLLGMDVMVRVDDVTACLMLQGPNAEVVLTEAISSVTVAQLGRFEHALFSVQGSDVMIARTSYSGEDGFEIFAGPTEAKNIWTQFVSLGARPVGFDALDIARIEAGLLFFGRDMTGAETPTELGLDFIVDLSKRDFRGKAALLRKRQAPRFRTVGVALDGFDPLCGRASVWMGGVLVGRVSSYAVSEWLGKTVAIAQIKSELAVNGQEINVFDEGCFSAEGRTGVVCPRHFYRNF